MSDERLLIVGTGAMACLFAARLAPVIDVVMLGTWQEGLQALAEQGVRLIESDGSQHVLPVQVTADPARCSGIAHVLVLVKSWQTARAAAPCMR